MASPNLIQNFHQTNDPKVVIEMILSSDKRLYDLPKSSVGVPLPPDTRPTKSNKVVCTFHVGLVGAVRAHWVLPTAPTSSHSLL